MKLAITQGAWRACLFFDLVLSASSLSVKAQIASVSSPNECSRTAGMNVYSDVFLHKETGDLLGYELAIKHQSNSDVDALLYVYEGGEAGEGIPLSGQLSKNLLTLKGTWANHLIEFPSKRKITEKHQVEISGIMRVATFHGKLTISETVDHQPIQLKHVERIWHASTGIQHLNPNQFPNHRITGSYPFFSFRSKIVRIPLGRHLTKLPRLNSSNRRDQWALAVS
jgi:hypothetical protein